MSEPRPESLAAAQEILTLPKRTTGFQEHPNAEDIAEVIDRHRQGHARPVDDTIKSAIQKMLDDFGWGQFEERDDGEWLPILQAFDAIRKQLREAEAQRDRLQAANAAMRAVLTKCASRSMILGRKDSSYPTCVICHERTFGAYPIKHKPDCELAAALADPTAPAPPKGSDQMDNPMTPEARASLVVQEVYARRTWAYDPNQHAEFEQLIAEAIRAEGRAVWEQARQIVATIKAEGAMHINAWGADNRDKSYLQHGVEHACDRVVAAIDAEVRKLGGHDADLPANG